MIKNEKLQAGNESLLARDFKKARSLFDEVLKEALSTVEVKVDLPEVQLPKITLAYMETPDQSLLPLADEILNALVGVRVCRGCGRRRRCGRRRGSGLRRATTSTSPTGR